MRKILFLLLLLILVCGCSISADADTVTELIDASGAEKMMEGESEIFGEFDADAVIQKLSSGKGFETNSLFKTVIHYFLKNLRENMLLCIGLICMSYLMGLFNNFTNHFGSKSVSACGHTVFYCIFAGFLAITFSDIAETLEIQPKICL